MSEIRGKVAVVTGAAGGIGRETALALAAKGADLAVCDIDGEGLRCLAEELESQGVEVMREIVDVSQAWQVEEFCGKVFERFGRADVLVNNAGIAIGGDAHAMELDDWNRIIGINLWGVIHGCHYFYPRFVEQGGGHIINVASAGGLLPAPGITAYCCTKFGVVGLSEALRVEGARFGVKVSAICPGFVATAIGSKAKICAAETRKYSIDEISEKIDVFMSKGMPASKVADAVLLALRKNKAVLVVGIAARLLDLIHRTSRGLVTLVEGAYMRLMDRFV